MPHDHHRLERRICIAAAATLIIWCLISIAAGIPEITGGGQCPTR